MAYTALPMSFCWINRFFADVVDEFLDYIRGAELVIHNASFDIGFMDYEFGLLKRDIPKTNTFCKVTDSLALARKMFPGKRNSLDALCSRYEIDNSKRTLHGALLDAQILAEVYLAMTGGQTSMTFAMEGETQRQQGEATIQRIVRQASRLRVVFASDEELAAHETRLDLVQKKGRKLPLAGVIYSFSGYKKSSLGRFFAATDSKGEKKR